MDTIDDYQRAKSTLERPKKPKAKEIFQGNIISTNNTRKMKLKDKYSRSEIEDMKVADIKNLIRAHNLHTTYIKGYSKLKKAGLVSSFLRHYQKAQTELKRRVTPQKSLDDVVAQALTINPGRPRKNPKYAAKRPKPTQLEKDLGVAGRTFPKGVRQTAKEDLEKGDIRRSARIRKKKETPKVTSSN